MRHEEDIVQAAGLRGEVHWRDSARSIKFFMWDGKAAFPLVLLFFHISWWTLFIALFSMVFFTVLNRFGFTPLVFMRWVRGLIAGPRKKAIPTWLS